MVGSPTPTRNDRNARVLVRASRFALSPPPEADPLAEALKAVRLSGAFCFLVEATAPYCIDVPHSRAYARIVLPEAERVFSFHVILEGGGVARAEGGQPVRFGAGDVLVFPGGDGYVMATSLDTPSELGPEETIEFFRALAAGALPFTVEEGGGGPPLTRVVCGFLGCDLRPFNPILAGLPPLLLMQGAAAPGAGGLLGGLVELALAEARSGGAGGRPVRVRLAELMFVELLRRYAGGAGEGPRPPGWLAGLGDAPVARALAAIHAEPAARWTLDALGRRAALSRSALARRFSERVGLPPLRYLALWRMQLAARMLAEGTAPVGEVGRRVGYEAEAAFSRAFKRVAGASPEAWRRGRAE